MLSGRHTDWTEQLHEIGKVEKLPETKLNPMCLSPVPRVAIQDLDKRKKLDHSLDHIFIMHTPVCI